MATTFKEFRDEQLKNPEIKKEYDALAPEYAIVRAMLEARTSQGITQQQTNLLPSPGGAPSAYRPLFEEKCEGCTRYRCHINDPAAEHLRSRVF